MFKGLRQDFEKSKAAQSSCLDAIHAYDSVIGFIRALIVISAQGREPDGREVGPMLREADRRAGVATDGHDFEAVSKSFPTYGQLRKQLVRLHFCMELCGTVLALSRFGAMNPDTALHVNEVAGSVTSPLLRSARNLLPGTVAQHRAAMVESRHIEMGFNEVIRPLWRNVGDLAENIGLTHIDDIPRI